MEVTFVRRVDQRDRIFVHRSNGGELDWQFATYGDQIPHDLVHVVVEAAFGLRRGFWGCVDAGLDPARVNAEADRATGGDKFAAYGEHHGEVLVAEALAAAFSSPDASIDERVGTIVELCARYDQAVPASVTAARVAEVLAVLDALRARWRTLRPKGALKVAFDPDAPGRSFDALAPASDRGPRA